MPENTFDIYQLKQEDATRELMFMGSRHLEANDLKVDPQNYNLIYSARLRPNDTLDSIYERFNIDRPKDFTGHSLSVSDVVVLHRDGKDTAHFVDSFGFKDVTDLWSDRPQVERKAEKPSILKRLREAAKNRPTQQNKTMEHNKQKAGQVEL